MIMITYKELLRTCIKPKKRYIYIYIYTVRTKSDSEDFPNYITVSPHLALHYVKEVFPDMYNSSIPPPLRIVGGGVSRCSWEQKINKTFFHVCLIWHFLKLQPVRKSSEIFLSQNIVSLHRK